MLESLFNKASGLRACNLKENPTQLSSREYCEIFKNRFLYSTTLHCVKSVQIRNFSGPYFLVFGLNTEICPNTGNTDQKKLRIWTQC